jgi:hypothetical protein
MIIYYQNWFPTLDMYVWCIWCLSQSLSFSVKCMSAEENSFVHTVSFKIWFWIYTFFPKHDICLWYILLNFRKWLDGTVSDATLYLAHTFEKSFYIKNFVHHCPIFHQNTSRCVSLIHQCPLQVQPMSLTINSCATAIGMWKILRCER